MNKNQSLKPINKLWISTTGEMFTEKCNIVTKDEGETFICLTHNRKCEFDEGVFCPITGD